MTRGPGSLVLAGLNAMTVTDEHLEQMVLEASKLSGINAAVVERVEAGLDFKPGCPHRPTARFYLLRVVE